MCLWRSMCNRIKKGHLVLIFHYHQLGTSPVPLSSFHGDPHWDVCKWRDAEWPCGQKHLLLSLHRGIQYFVFGVGLSQHVTMKASFLLLHTQSRVNPFIVPWRRAQKLWQSLMLGLSWFILCCTRGTKQSGGWAGFPLLPLQLLALKIFQIFNCKVGGFKVWSLRQSGQFFMWMAKKHSWNKGPSPPDRLKFLLQSMALVRASLLAGYLILFFFSIPKRVHFSLIQITELSELF